MEKRTSHALLIASVAGMVAAAGAVWSGQTAAADEGGSVHCYGVNKCKGTGDCGGKGHSCAGKNGCEGQGYIDISEKNCLRIKGGSLTAEPEAS